jgi:hypothetical protein
MYNFRLIMLAVAPMCISILFATSSAAAAIDGLQYIASYDDLIRAYGPDAAAGVRHYERYGQAEGRSPDNFDEVQYLANYRDLQAAYGTNLQAATIHFIVHGYTEGRTSRNIACPARSACQKRVRSGTELAAALQTATCGCDIVLAEGTYDGSFALARICPRSQPINIRGEHPLGPVLTSGLTLGGANAAVVGLRFTGAASGIAVGGLDNRVLRNRFSGWVNSAVKATAGSGVEIAYNELSTPAPWSQGGKTRIGIISNEPRGGLNMNAHVYRNHFHDFADKPGDAYRSGQADAIEICGARQDISRTKVGWTIERNLIERHHQAGAAVIDIKCSGTTVQFNTLLASPGARIDLRNGYFNNLIANWLEETSGIVIHGGLHRVIGNRLISSKGITLTAGTVPSGYTGPTMTPSGSDVHQPAQNVLLAGNTATAVLVGLSYNATFRYPADGTVIEQFVGPVSYGLAANTLRPLASMNIPAAVKLGPSDVGPFAGGDCSLP